MTRTTLKALWVGGGGILATWLAVSPHPSTPATSPDAAVQRPAPANQPTAEDLTAKTSLLRQRTGSGLRPSTRNPFRFNARKPAVRSTLGSGDSVPPAVTQPIVPAAPPGPVLKLSGVAQKAGKRTAVIAGDGQIYLVAEGDSVAGRYTVVKVDPEAVLLRDAAGAEQRLVLPQ